jgi:bifunctional DNA primase/polymerase-like protein
VRCHRVSSPFYDPSSAPAVVIAASQADPVKAAEQYLKLGFSAIPLRGKIPAVTWREYQKRRPTPGELWRWARRGLFHNVGLVCGKVSGDLVVLDFDAPEVYDAFRIHFPDLTQTYTVATGGGGWHVYLRVDELPSSLYGKGVELCADGRQIVVPPSIHPTTHKPYRVALPLDIRRVSDPSEVVEWVERSRGPVKLHKTFAGQVTMTGTTTNTMLVAAIVDALRARGFQQKGDWLNGPCIYPERHAHNDSRNSFGFNVRTGYGNCFRCGPILAKDIARSIRLDPGSFKSRGRYLDDEENTHEASHYPERRARTCTQ